MDEIILDIFSDEGLFEQEDYFQPTHFLHMQIYPTTSFTDTTDNQASTNQTDFPEGPSKSATVLSHFSDPNWLLVTPSDQKLKGLSELPIRYSNTSAKVDSTACQSQDGELALPSSSTTCILGHYACTQHLSISTRGSISSLVSSTPTKRVEHPSKTPDRTQISSKAAAKRATHNIIEKRYRENINKKFAALERVLRAKEYPYSSGKSAGPLRKSNILAKAIIYIQELQTDNILLQGELDSIKTAQAV